MSAAAVVLLVAVALFAGFAIGIDYAYRRIEKGRRNRR